MYHLAISLDELATQVNVWFEYEDAEPEVNAPKVLILNNVWLGGVDILEVLSKETIDEIEEKIFNYRNKKAPRGVGAKG